MAIRVRKLAKQLKRDPVELLGVLQAIGIGRYRSPEDMLSSTIEAKLRRAIQQGVKPVQVEPQAVRKKQTRPKPVLPPQEQVLRQRQPVVQAPQQANRPVPSPAAVPAPVPAPSEESKAMLAALAEERVALEALRQQLTTRIEAPRPITLGSLLDERGLVGMDEAERALRVLADRRRLVEILPYLTVSEPERVRRFLADVLLLVDGPPPEALAGEATVTVAAERAEVPSPAAFRRQTEQISEQLMLNGLRRVVIVGGPVRMHRLLARSFDPRVELRFRPASRVVAGDAQADVDRTDAIVLWDVQVDPDADAVYASSKALVARVQGERLDALFRHWLRALAG